MKGVVRHGRDMVLPLVLGARPDCKRLILRTFYLCFGQYLGIQNCVKMLGQKKRDGLPEDSPNWRRENYTEESTVGHLPLPTPAPRFSSQVVTQSSGQRAITVGGYFFKQAARCRRRTDQEE